MEVEEREAGVDPVVVPIVLRLGEVTKPVGLGEFHRAHPDDVRRACNGRGDAR